MMRNKIRLVDIEHRKLNRQGNMVASNLDACHGARRATSSTKSGLPPIVRNSNRMEDYHSRAHILCSPAKMGKYKSFAGLVILEVQAVCARGREPVSGRELR
jgi:hypothetical protein